MLWFYLCRGRRIATFLFMHNSNFAHQKHSSMLEKYGFVAEKTDSLCTFSQFLWQQRRQLSQEAFHLLLYLLFIEHRPLLQSFGKERRFSNDDLVHIISQYLSFFQWFGCFYVRFRGGISSLLTHSPEPRKTVVPLLHQGQKQFSCYKYWKTSSGNYWQRA